MWSPSPDFVSTDLGLEHPVISMQKTDGQTHEV